MALLNKLPITGTVAALLLQADRGAGLEKHPVRSLRLTFAGPEGDCHAGLTREADSRTLALYKRGTEIRNVRQVTIVSEEELAEIAIALGVPVIEPSWFGANIVVRGIPDFTLLPPSTRLQFSSGGTLVVDMENLPCSQIAEVVGRHYPDVQFKLVKVAAHKRGVTAWVEREGEIRSGDTVVLVVPPQRLYPHA